MRTWLWIRSLFRTQRVERELDEELRFHFDQQVEENLAAGMPPREAELTARRMIGGMAQIQEECRDARRTAWITDFVRDLHYATRTLGRAPAFTFAVTLTLGLGIGANTAIFSIADAVLLRVLPVRQPERLFQVLRPEFNTGEYFDLFSFVNYREMQTADSEQADLVAERTAAGPGPVIIDGSIQATARRAEVSGNYFDVLGVTMALGTGMRPNFDQEPGKHAVAVISYEFWRHFFRGDPHALGRMVTVAGVPFQITGVAEPGFSGVQVGAMADVWTPVSMQPPQRLRMPHLTYLRILGRLKAGADLERALAPLQVQYRRNREEDLKTWPSSTPPSLAQRWLAQRLKLTPAARGISPLREQYGDPLKILWMVVALVLLVACGNVANLFLARAGMRQREMAVRLSLGAGRPRLVRQLLAESLILACGAAVLGLLVARWSLPLLVRLLAPADSPVQLVLDLDWRVLAFTAISAAVTAILFGLFPALRATNVEIHGALKSGARLTSAAGGRAGKLMVAGQVALSLVLVATSALFLRTLLNLHHLDTGFDRRNLIIAGMQFEGSAENKRLDLMWEDLRRRMASISGVESASLSVGTPFTGAYGSGPLRIAGAQSPARVTPCWFYAVSLDYLRTLDSPLLAGRDLEARDFAPGAPAVAVVSESVARAYFGQDSPVGRKIGNFEQEDGSWTEVVGVARDMKFQSLRAPSPPIVYLPSTMAWSGAKALTLEVRARRDSGLLAPALRRAATAAGAGFSVHNITTETRLIDDSLARERLLATLASFFGGLALLLAAIGLYGITTYSVARRTPEIGIRMAVGAARADVLGMILREALVLVASGALAGVGAAYFAGRAVVSLLFGLKPGDPATTAGALAVLAGTALAATAIPAWRASRTDPMTALREE
jgi:predicted permease